METNEVIRSIGKRKQLLFVVKTISIQGYDPYQIKKEELSGDISKFPAVQ